MGRLSSWLKDDGRGWVIAAGVVLAALVAVAVIIERPSKRASDNPINEFGLHGVSCGESNPRSIGGVEPKLTECILEAFASGAVKYLILRQATVESDPILTTFQVIGRSHVVVTTDTRADEFGERAVKRKTCAKLSTGGPDGSPGGELLVSECGPEDVDT